MGVSKNNGTPKSSILIGFSIIFTIHFGGPPIFLETPICETFGGVFFVSWKFLCGFVGLCRCVEVKIWNSSKYSKVPEGHGMIWGSIPRSRMPARPRQHYRESEIPFFSRKKTVQNATERHPRSGVDTKGDLFWGLSWVVPPPRMPVTTRIMN